MCWTLLCSAESLSKHLCHLGAREGTFLFYILFLHLVCNSWWVLLGPSKGVSVSSVKLKYFTVLGVENHSVECQLGVECRGEFWVSVSGNKRDVMAVKSGRAQLLLDKTVMSCGLSLLRWHKYKIIWSNVRWHRGHSIKSLFTSLIKI